MRKFILEYQKYDNVKYSKSEGFKSKGNTLRKLNSLQRDIEKLRVTPFIGKAVNSYFNFYKGLNINFNSVESTMINFLFIQEWKNSYKKLRGFSFNSKRFDNVKLDKYSQDTLILQHLYTNLCLKPNLKNIKAEWIDLLITKIYYNGYKDRNKNEVIKFLSQIKESCVSASESIPMFSNEAVSYQNNLQAAAQQSIKSFNDMQKQVKVNSLQQNSIKPSFVNLDKVVTDSPYTKQSVNINQQQKQQQMQQQAQQKSPGLNTVSFADLVSQNQYKINRLQ